MRVGRKMGSVGVPVYCNLVLVVKNGSKDGWLKITGIIMLNQLQ